MICEYKQKNTVISKFYLLKNTSIITFVNGIGVGAGILLDAMILAYYGISEQTDALFVAMTIPRLICGLIELKSPTVLVPLFTKSFKEDGQTLTFRIAGNFITISITLLLIISIVGVLLAETLIPIQAPGLKEEAVKLSSQLSKIFFWLILFRGMSGILKSFLFVYHQYLVTSSTKLIGHTTTIIVMTILYKQFNIYAVAYGFLIGSMIELAIVVSALVCKGFKLWFSCRLNDPKLHRIFKLSVYPCLDQGLSQVRILIENFLVSFFASGNLSILRYAYRIVDAITGVMLGGIATTSLPLVCKFSEANNNVEVKRTIMRAIKMLLYIFIPICFFLIFVGEPMLNLLFVRGKFTESNVILMSAIIVLMVPSIILNSFIDITQVPFFAKMNMRIPVLGSALQLFAFIIVVIVLIKNVGVYSFPIAYSIASLLNAIFMLILLHKTYGTLGWKNLKDFGYRLFGVAFTTALAFILGSNMADCFFTGKIFIDKMINFCVPSILGVTAFLLTSTLLRFIGLDSIKGLLGKA